MGYDAALPRRASDVLAATGTAYSLLMMSMGAGSLAGAFLLAGFARRVHFGYVFFATSILSGLTLVPLGSRPPGRVRCWGRRRSADPVGVHRAGDDLAPGRHPRSGPRAGDGLYWGSTGGGWPRQSRDRPSPDCLAPGRCSRCRVWPLSCDRPDAVGPDPARDLRPAPRYLHAVRNESAGADAAD